jgi:hypothetical protein
MTDVVPSAPPAGSGTTAAAARAGRPPSRPPLSATAAVTTLGNLAWIGWVWLATGVVVTGITVVVGTVDGGELNSSLWQSAGAVWQRWIVLAAGVVLVTTFAPLLISHGVTRAQVSASAIVTMVALAALGTLFIVAGYLVEGVVFDRNGWAQVLDRREQAIDAGTLLGLSLRYALTLAASFVSGWLIGIGVRCLGCQRWAPRGGLVLVPSALIPIVVSEILLDGQGGLGIGPLNDLAGPPLAVGAPASVAVIALAALAAKRWTSDLVLEGG